MYQSLVLANYDAKQSIRVSRLSHSLPFFLVPFSPTPIAPDPKRSIGYNRHEVTCRVTRVLLVRFVYSIHFYRLFVVFIRWNEACVCIYISMYV